MSNKSDPSQGMVAAPKNPRRLPTPKPKSAAQVKAQAQPALNAQARKFGGIAENQRKD